MIDMNKKYTYNGKPVRIYADGSDTMMGKIHIAFQFSDGKWKCWSCDESELVEVWEPKEGEPSGYCAKLGDNSCTSGSIFEGVIMTKEKMEENIICLLGYCNDNVINSINDIFEEFTRTNVCIHKGANPHPYADVLHEWIEGACVVADSRIDSIYSGRILEHCSLTLDETNYRIKPSEPVYEWQWEDDFSLVETKKFYTKLEIEETFNYKMNKIEETKRIRQ
ncbi:MAG: hypothetical protein ACYDD5_01100 [Sulfuricurvum sp.]